MLRAEHQMKAFLRAHMYRHPAVLELTNAAQSVVGTLAEAYLAAPERMPEEWGGELPASRRGAMSAGPSRPAERMPGAGEVARSEEHTSELQPLMRISSDVFCLHKNTTT